VFVQAPSRAGLEPRGLPRGISCDLSPRYRANRGRGAGSEEGAALRCAVGGYGDGRLTSPATRRSGRWLCAREHRLAVRSRRCVGVSGLRALGTSACARRVARPEAGKAGVWVTGVGRAVHRGLLRGPSSSLPARTSSPTAWPSCPPAEGERRQQAAGGAPVAAPRRVVHLPAGTGPGHGQLAGGVGHPLRRHLLQGLERQPHLASGAGAGGADVGVADVLAAGAFGAGLPQSTPARRVGGPGHAPATYCAPAYATRQTLSPSPAFWYDALIANTLSLARKPEPALVCRLGGPRPRERHARGSRCGAPRS
jgi:hypothetical protein